jgi:CRISPR-associated protein Csd1
MILQALYRYYEILLKDRSANIAMPGYSAAKVYYALNLSPEGELLDIVPCSTSVQGGKKSREVPYRLINVPERVKRTGTSAGPNFLCDNSTFVLGITGRKTKSGEEDVQFARMRFEAFRRHNLELLGKAHSRAAHAVIRFLENYQPRTAHRHPAIDHHLAGLLKGGNVIFQVAGKDVLGNAEIRRVWEAYQADEEAATMQCLVTGEIEPIARLHPTIHGVQGTGAMGASLVAFNEPAYESFNHGQGHGLNSPTSRHAASGYGVALNYLLSSRNPNRKIYLGDTTVVFWADSPDPRYAQTFAALVDPGYGEDRLGAEGNGRRAAQRLQTGQPLDLAALCAGLDDGTRFHVLGLAPNKARLVVRFFLSEPFGTFVERIQRHYEDLSIGERRPDQRTYLSPSRILAQCVSPKTIHREDELKTTWGMLGGALMRSILAGTLYPAALYYAILNRIRADADEKSVQKIGYARAAIIRAYLLRKYRRHSPNHFREVLVMSLNEQSAVPAYLLGRLFAVLEDVQLEAIGRGANATLKDRYFTAACASPARVFPVLLRLSQQHISKAEHGRASNWRIQKILNLLDVEKNPIPARLSLDEQGVFVLGYYHQRAAFYAPQADRCDADISSP